MGAGVGSARHQEADPGSNKVSPWRLKLGLIPAPHHSSNKSGAVRLLSQPPKDNRCPAGQHAFSLAEDLLSGSRPSQESKHTTAGKSPGFGNKTGFCCFNGLRPRFGEDISRATRPDKGTQDNRPGLTQREESALTGEGTLTGTKWGTRGLIGAHFPLPPIHVAEASTTAHMKYCFREINTNGAADRAHGHLTSQLEKEIHGRVFMDTMG